VTARRLAHRRAGPLGHETLSYRWNHPIVRRHEVPARLGPPRRFRHLAVERVEAPRHLRLGYELRQRRSDIRRERSGELRLIEEQEPVLRREKWRHGWPPCGSLGQPCNPLALVGH